MTNGFFPLRRGQAGYLPVLAVLDEGAGWGWLAGWVALCALLGVSALTGGCAAGNSVPIRLDPDFVTGLVNRVQESQARIEEIGGNVRALDQSVSNFDRWALRTAIGGLVLVALSYPLGKTLWLGAGRIRNWQSRRRSRCN